MRKCAPSVETCLRAAALCAACVALPALPQAADLAPPPAFTWTGFYLGANIGGALTPGNSTYQSIGFPSSDFDLFASNGPKGSFTGGFQAGYNYQIGPFVPGLETDFNYLSNCRGGTFGASPAYAPLGIESFSLSGGCSQYFGTLRGRLGYAFDRVLLYATAGVAYGGNRDPGSITLGPSGPRGFFYAGASHSARTKYAFGAGVEYALSDHWFARAEYQYVDLGRIDQFFDNSAAQTYATSQFNRNQIFRLGLNYKWDPPGAEPAPAGAIEPAAPATSEPYSVHGQVTFAPQYHPGFPAAYSGANSLPPHNEIKENFAATAFLGLALWDGAALYITPEIDQGFGVGNTFGVAGFPSALAYKVGKSEPYVRMQRYFLRETFGLGGGTEGVDAGADQLAGHVDSNRVTVTAGKYSVVDIFDDNKYAHDPTGTFLNWTIIDMGAFDYAADSWAYTYGVTAEWKQDWWTLRAGYFQLSQVPNGEVIEPVLFRQFESVVELEERHAIMEQPGKLKFLFFANDGFMGSYNQAVAEGAALGVTPDITSTRAKRVKVGGGVNLEQQITPNFGLFGRFSMATGQYETFDFTEVERSLSGGLVIGGEVWGVPKDQIGIGGVINGITNAHARYLAAGGLGTLLGDGALSYDGEYIFETYYKHTIADGLHISGDYQFVDNPGYNRARGPVSLFALRLHAEF